MLTKLGYTFDITKLEQWELEAYTLIANTVHDEQQKDMKKRK